MVFQVNLGTIQAPRATAGGRRPRVGLYLTGVFALPIPYVCEVNYKRNSGVRGYSVTFPFFFPDFYFLNPPSFAHA
jgi:hypothetical protein